jgi:hypothetical protein
VISSRVRGECYRDLSAEAELRGNPDKKSTRCDLALVFWTFIDAEDLEKFNQSHTMLPISPTNRRRQLVTFSPSSSASVRLEAPAICIAIERNVFGGLLMRHFGSSAKEFFRLRPRSYLP